MGADMAMKVAIVLPDGVCHGATDLQRAGILDPATDEPVELFDIVAFWPLPLNYAPNDVPHYGHDLYASGLVLAGSYDDLRELEDNMALRDSRW